MDNALATFDRLPRRIREALAAHDDKYDHETIAAYLEQGVTEDDILFSLQIEQKLVRFAERKKIVANV